jgi:thiazole synthase
MKSNQKSEDGLQLGDRVLSSRLLMGTGKFSSREVMLDAIKASGSQLVTVALRRFNREQDAADD